MKKNIRINNQIVVLVLFILSFIFVVAGATFAFLRSNTSNTGIINGELYSFDVGVDLEVIKSDGLIPTANNLISQSLNSQRVCLDRRDYSLCSLYKITITNSGVATSLTGYVSPITGTTYTTNNLRYQLFTKSGNTYTAASDIGTINITSNSKNYFTLNSNNISVSMTDGSTTEQTVEYYLVIWLTDTGSNQPADISKRLVGNVVFELSNGEAVTSQFTS